MATCVRCKADITTEYRVELKYLQDSLRLFYERIGPACDPCARDAYAFVAERIRSFLKTPSEREEIDRFEAIGEY